jgi:hypothetical protein
MTDTQSDKPKRKTTYDLALEALTVQYPPVAVGSTQVMSGVTFEWNGNEWVEK